MNENDSVDDNAPKNGSYKVRRRAGSVGWRMALRPNSATRCYQTRVMRVCAADIESGRQGDEQSEKTHER